MARFHGLDHFNRNGFNRNAFGSRQAWNRWGGRHWGAGWNRWGAGWGGWLGPVFWPYMYGDVFTYLLWPDDYYDPFWDYGYPKNASGELLEDLKAEGLAD